MSTIGKYIFSCKGCGNHVAAGIFSEEDADWLKRLQSDARLFCEPEHVPVEGTVVNACKCTPVERFATMFKESITKYTFEQEYKIALAAEGLIALYFKTKYQVNVFCPPGYRIMSVYISHAKKKSINMILFEEL